MRRTKKVAQHYLGLVSPRSCLALFHINNWFWIGIFTWSWRWVCCCPFHVWVNLPAFPVEETQGYQTFHLKVVMLQNYCSWLILKSNPWIEQLGFGFIWWELKPRTQMLTPKQTLREPVLLNPLLLSQLSVSVIYWPCMR